ncbi:MAG: hypothetical protein QGD94_09465, partial [Planctomycetia bacterium]|nr:hypothetical protein [Planctomycetia bacterium]
MRYTCPHCRREFDVLEGSPQPAQCPLCGKALPPQAAHKPRTSRLAIASLILGIVAFASFPFMALLLLEFAPRGPQNVLAFVVVFFLVVPPISALLAVVFGVSVRRRPRRAGARLKGSWLKNTGEFLGVVSLTIWFVTAIVFLPGSWPRPSTELAQRVQSAANLTEIGIGLAVHATTYRGRYPPNLQALVEMDYITAEILKNPRPREHD